MQAKAQPEVSIAIPSEYLYSDSLQQAFLQDLVTPGLLRCSPHAESIFLQATTHGRRVAQLSQQQADLYSDNADPDQNGKSPPKEILEEIKRISDEKILLGREHVLRLPIGNLQLGWEHLRGITEDWVHDIGMEAWCNLVLETVRLASGEALPISLLDGMFPLAYLEADAPKESASSSLRELARQFRWGDFKYTYIPVNLTTKQHWILLRINWEEHQAEVYNSRRRISHNITPASCASTPCDDLLTAGTGD